VRSGGGRFGRALRRFGAALWRALGRRAASFSWALRGIGSVLASEPNARIEAVLAAAAALLGLWLGLPARDWALLSLACAALLAAESFNTAVERLVDRIAPGRDPGLARIKDLAAGAVLLIALAAAAVLMVVLAPPLWARLGG